jgi:hypothetical protein
MLPFQLSRAGLLPGEYRSLFDLRRESLDRVAEVDGMLGPPPAAERTGYRSRVYILPRAKDGSLRARITVWAPHLSEPYVRKVRLQREQPLPRSLR